MALGSGALVWPEEHLLCFSDLHFGKSQRIMRQGGLLLPPYETQDTLLRIEADIRAYDPKIIICLGDSFDDMLAAETLPEKERLWIARLQAGREWIWIEGNHDPETPDMGGTYRHHFEQGPLFFRHIAEQGARPGEVSGHYHPKLHRILRGVSISRSCFLFDDTRLILPSYGTYTGGLKTTDPIFRTLFPKNYKAITTGDRPVILPL